MEGAKDLLLNALLLEGAAAILLPIVYFAVVMVLAWLVGSAMERAHLKRLAAGEAELRGIVATNCPAPDGMGDTALVSGSVVVANDFFKAWRARWRGIIGGNIRHYETLVMRARREAVLRLKRDAARLGAGHVCGVRLQTSKIGLREGKGGVEVLAYGTAVRARDTESG